MQDGFFLVNKESDWTSRDVCNKISHIFNMDKVGHSGTLDPFAEGLMLVACNKATKAVAFLDNFNKTYTAQLYLGKSTSTGDKNGEIEKEMPVPNLNKEMINDVLNNFLGKQMQIPPMTSAVHFEGVKLYQLAHKGISVARPPREIEIYDIKLINFSNNIITFSVTVSKGTYIRTLGEDIAVKLGTVGHLISLFRTNVGNFDVKNAQKIDKLDLNQLISIKSVLSSSMPCLTITDLDTLTKIKHGGKLSKKLFDSKNETYCFFDENDIALAIYQLNPKGYYECLRGF